jgi:hypothetical protein
LNEVVVIEFNIFRAFIDCADINFSIGEAKIKGSSAIEVSSNTKDLKDKRALKSCTDVDDGVFGEKLHSDKYSLL